MFLPLQNDSLLSTLFRTKIPLWLSRLIYIVYSNFKNSYNNILLLHGGWNTLTDRNPRVAQCNFREKTPRASNGRTLAAKMLPLFPWIDTNFVNGLHIFRTRGCTCLRRVRSEVPVASEKYEQVVCNWEWKFTITTHNYSRKIRMHRFSIKKGQFKTIFSFFILPVILEVNHHRYIFLLEDLFNSKAVLLIRKLQVQAF